MDDLSGSSEQSSELKTSQEVISDLNPVPVPTMVNLSSIEWTRHHLEINHLPPDEAVLADHLFLITMDVKELFSRIEALEKGKSDE